MHPTGHRTSSADQLFRALVAHSLGGSPLAPSPPPFQDPGSPAADDLLLQGGAMLGGVHLVSLIGVGAMGRVYLGHHKTLDIEVAVKVMRPGERAQAERFINEARLAARTQHANIVRTLHAGYEGGRMFLVQEYVAGINLKQLLRQSGPLPWKQSVHFAVQAARGLGAAHQAGIVHRDIKPSNLLITPHSTLKIVDLGLAGHAAQGQEWIGAAGILGTPAYMAPEQARDVRKAGPRADVYALGITLFHMLSGNVPFERTSNTNLLLAHIHEPVPDIRATVDGLPPPLVALLERMLAKDPSSRPADGYELERELEQIAQSAGRQAATGRPPRPVQGFALGLFRRRPGLLAAAGFGTLVLAALALALSRPGSNPPADGRSRHPAGSAAPKDELPRPLMGARPAGGGADSGLAGQVPAAPGGDADDPWQTPEQALVVHCADVPADVVVAVHMTMIASGLPVIDRDLRLSSKPEGGPAAGLREPDAGRQAGAPGGRQDRQPAAGVALDIAAIGQRIEVRAALIGSGELAFDELVEPTQAAAATARAIAAGTALLPERGWLLAHGGQEHLITLGSRHGAHVGDRFAVLGGDALHPGAVLGYATVTSCARVDARVRLEVPGQALRLPGLVYRMSPLAAPPPGPGN
jgi:hypothetical protein